MRGGAEVLGVGVVGTGFAAAAHLDALARVPGVEVRGVAASTRERGVAAAARLGVAKAYRDWQELVSDPRVDVVHDCTPNHLHLEVNSAALAAGKHLLSEKPLAMDSREATELVVAAGRASVVTGVCFNYRHFPLVRQLRDELASGAHGSFHLVHGSYLQDWLLEETDWSWRLETEKGGGSRAVADIGSHWIDLVQHVTAQAIVEVCADVATLHATRLRPARDIETFAHEQAAERIPVEVDTEDLATVLLRFANGARGALTVSQVSAGRKNHLFVEVDAARSAFAWDQEQPNTLWIGRRDGPNRELPRDPGLLTPAAAGLARYPGGHQEGWPDALRNLFEEFYAVVRGDPSRAAFASFEEARRVLAVVEAIIGSSRSGGWVRVEEEQA